MNHLTDCIYLALYVAPAVTAMVCAMLVAFSCGDRRSRTEARVKLTALLYLCAAMLSWVSLVLFLWFPAVFVPVQSLVSFVLICEQVLFYLWFFVLTARDGHERFSPWHFAAPALIAVIFLIWSLFIPYDTQIEIVRENGRVVPEGYELYTRLLLTKLPVRGVFAAVYIILLCLRLRNYYRKLNAHQSLVRRPAWWILLLVSLAAASVIISVATVLIQAGRNPLTLAAGVPSVFSMVMYIVLTVTVLRRSYLLYVTYPDEPLHGEMPAQTPAAPVKKPRRSYSPTGGNALTRAGFEAFMRREKPWLDPSLSLVGLAGMMDVNRAYLSGFVNHTYGMNFNRYVNRLRLREVERLRGLAANRDKPLKELVEKAGFSSVKYYNSIVAAQKGGEL